MDINHSYPLNGLQYEYSDREMTDNNVNVRPVRPLGNTTLLYSFRTSNGVIQPVQSLLISTNLTVGDFKTWIAEAWNVREAEVKKPNASTGGRVWMGVVYRINQMIIIRKYKMDVEEYWMVTYVGPISMNPEETKRRKIVSSDPLSTMYRVGDGLPNTTSTLPSSCRPSEDYLKFSVPDQDRAVGLKFHRPEEQPVGYGVTATAAPSSSTVSSSFPSPLVPLSPSWYASSAPASRQAIGMGGVNSSSSSAALTTRTADSTTTCAATAMDLLQPEEADAADALLAMIGSSTSDSSAQADIVDTVFTVRREFNQPSVMRNTILESLYTTVGNGVQPIQPEEKLLLSAKLKVGDFKTWVAHAWGVHTSEVRKAPACTGGRVWMAMAERTAPSGEDRMIILRKYRIDSEEYWMVTYLGRITSDAAEVRRSKIEHISSVSVGGGGGSAGGVGKDKLSASANSNGSSGETTLEPLSVTSSASMLFPPSVQQHHHEKQPLVYIKEETHGDVGYVSESKRDSHCDHDSVHSRETSAGNTAAT